jgi:hypothetical protein
LVAADKSFMEVNEAVSNSRLDFRFKKLVKYLSDLIGDFHYIDSLPAMGKSQANIGLKFVKYP